MSIRVKGVSSVLTADDLDRLRAVVRDYIATVAAPAPVRRPPPEPWRPSVDEWDLLPDAAR